MYCAEHTYAASRGAEDRRRKIVDEHGSLDAYKLEQSRLRQEKRRESSARWAADNPEKVAQIRERERRQRNAERRAKQAERLASVGRLSVVYFVRSGSDGPIKIGWTSQPDLSARLRSLQCGNPERLTIVGVMHGKGVWDERDLHSRFSSDRVRPDGEWFQPSTELTDFIVANAQSWTDGESEEAERRRKPEASEAAA